MNMTISNMLPALPEIFLLIMALMALMSGVLFPQIKNLTYYLAQLTILIAALITIFVFWHVDLGNAVELFNNGFVLDRLAVILKLFIFLSVFFTFIYARHYNQSRKIQSVEFYVLGLLSTLGMMILVSSHNLLTLFLGLELFSLPTYAMVAMQREKIRGIEAAMKYFVIGAVASGMLLYGLSMIFGATQSLDMVIIAKAIAATPLTQNLILVFGLVFVLAGVAFKLGAAPFHLWVPDVYDGAPSSVTLFIAAAPKIAAFAMVIRLLIDTMPSLQGQWQQMLMVMAILSMAIGNLSAIVQTNIKRMLGYSSIAHMGYMLLGVLCATPRGYAAAMFYIITYSLMSLGAFGMLILMSHSGVEVETIEDFSGLNNRNPWLAFMMLLVMFALAGVPPLVGFIAKVGVLESLIRVHMVWLAVVAVIFAIIGAYYYLRVVQVMYFEKGSRSDPFQCSSEMKVVITLNGLAVLVVGVFPGWLYELSHYAFLVHQ